MHRKYFLAEHEACDMRRELLRRDMLELGSGSLGGESPDPPPEPTIDYTPESVADYTPKSPGARPHPTGVARNFRSLFRRSSATAKGKEKVGDRTLSQNKTEEEDPEE